MTDTERGEERKHQVERYRLLAQEITDPLAAFLLSDQISKVEALLKGGQQRSWLASSVGAAGCSGERPTDVARTQ